MATVLRVKSSMAATLSVWVKSRWRQSRPASTKELKNFSRRISMRMLGKSLLRWARVITSRMCPPISSSLRTSARIVATRRVSQHRLIATSKMILSEWFSSFSSLTRVKGREFHSKTYKLAAQWSISPPMWLISQSAPRVRTSQAFLWTTLASTSWMK